MLTSANRQGPVILSLMEIRYAFPFGIAYLAAHLKKHGEDVQVRFVPFGLEERKRFASRVIAAKPLLLGLGGLYPDLRNFRELIAELDRQGRDFPVVIGGQMVSPVPEFAVKITGADIGVIGEGEISLFNLVQTLRQGGDVSSLKGLVLREGEETQLTGPGEFIEDLSGLPPIPYEMFPTERWLNIGRYYTRLPQPHWRYRDRVISIHGGRGCPYNCNFCYHHSKCRYRPMDDMLAEADELLERFDANMLYFGDDLVIASPKRATQLTEGLRRLKRPVEYSISCRFNVLARIDDALLGELRDTGCRIMGLGIESGSQPVLDRMRKKITVEQIRSGLGRLKKVGILPTVSIMVGQLDETLEDYRRSLELMKSSVRENKNINYFFTVATPYPGSELYDLAFQRGLLADDMDFYKRFERMSQVTVNFSKLTDTEIEAGRNLLEEEFKREKELAAGSKAMTVERWRKSFTYWYEDKDARYLRRLASLPLMGWTPVAGAKAYDLAQIALDRTRLMLLGLK